MQPGIRHFFNAPVFLRKKTVVYYFKESSFSRFIQGHKRFFSLISLGRIQILPSPHDIASVVNSLKELVYQNVYLKAL
ncbi:MAG: hypothetical protein JW867_00800, partial [Candidatus Omnitrophica bacterium]|nr:hypothetical protein [Candidatus Omnitrophota bacterium]